MTKQRNYPDSLSPSTNIAALQMEAAREANEIARKANRIATIAAIAAVIAAIAAIVAAVVTVNAKEAIELIIKTS